MAGLLTPIYYDILKGKGDWITGMLISLDRDPVLVLQQSFCHQHREQRPGSRTFASCLAGQDRTRSWPRCWRTSRRTAETIAVSKMLWGRDAPLRSKPGRRALLHPAGDDMMGAVRAVKDPDELALMQRAAGSPTLAMRRL